VIKYSYKGGKEVIVVKKLIGWLVIFLGVGVMAVGAIAQSSYTQPSQVGEVAKVVEETAHGSINWTEDYVEASGSAVPPTTAVNPAQGKLLAKRGAILDLQRNLLETIKGVRIDSQTLMENFMVKSDIVRSEVEGWVKGVEVVREKWDGEIYTVWGRIYLKKVRKVVADTLGIQPKEVTPPPPKANYTGLVLDARDVPLIPATTFRILDPNGKEVYSINHVDRERFMASGMAAYQTNINWATGDPRVGTRPLVAKAIKTVSPNNVDVVISQKEADAIRNNNYDFRPACRVIVVKR